MSYIQSNFSGGMNLFDEESSLAENEYGLAFNVRNRTTALSSIKGASEDTQAPKGKKQGLYAFDKYLLLFCGGQAYYKDILLDSNWTKIANLSLDPYVDHIYTQAVPASQLNYQRKLKVNNQIAGSKTVMPLFLNPILVRGNKAGLVVQDGINQPWFIDPDGTADRIQTYEQWNKDNAREYVPVMKNMTYKDGILFGVAPDGISLYRSVSGRPLDFVVNVDVNGDKGGNASTTAYSVSFEPITCLFPIISGQLVVATANNCFPITSNYDNTIFAEPTFINTNQFATGVVNQFSILSNLRNDGSGYVDYLFIDTDGFRSFNASITNNNEGRNSNFTRYISSAVDGKQTATCAIDFQDYAMFSIKTKFSADNLVAIYDKLRDQWVCFDDYGTGTIVQFAIATQLTNPILYAITDQKVYKLFAATEYLQSKVKFKSLTSGSIKNQLKLDNIRTVFIGGNLTGTISAKEYTNGYSGKIINDSLEGKLLENVRFNFQMLASQAFTVQPEITWQNDSRLLGIEVEVTGMTQNTPIQQQARIYNGQ